MKKGSDAINDSPSWPQSKPPYYENMYYFIISFQNISISYRYIEDFSHGVKIKRY